MPEGVPTPWKVDPLSGAILPYYEGSFRVRTSNNLVIDGELVPAGQRTIDPYQPEQLIFTRQTGDGQPGDEIGGIWARYPDPLAPPADMPDPSDAQVWLRAGGVSIPAAASGPKRLLLDRRGKSDFVQRSIVSQYNPTYVSPWQSYGGVYSPVITEYNDGLTLIEGLVTTNGAGAYGTQYVMYVPQPAIPRNWLYIVQGYAGATVLEHMRFDIIAAGASSNITFQQHIGVADGSAVIWAPLNLFYHRVLT